MVDTDLSFVSVVIMLESRAALASSAAFLCSVDSDYFCFDGFTLTPNPARRFVSWNRKGLFAVEYAEPAPR